MSTTMQLSANHYLDLLETMIMDSDWARTITDNFIDQGGIKGPDGIKRLTGIKIEHDALGIVGGHFDRLIEYRMAETAYEEREKQRTFMGKIGCTAMGVRDEGDTRIKWWVFPRGLTEDQILDKLWDAGITAYGTSWTSAYDCTGRWFAGPASIKTEQGSRTLVTQSWGMDV